MQIIRAGLSHHSMWIDDSPALTVMYVVNRLIASESESAQTRTKACFILSDLVADDKELCELAYQRRSVEKLAGLIKNITPTEKSVEWEDDEPESISCLREAALTAVASISLFDDNIRAEVVDKQALIPAIQTSLTHPHIGVRYAACQCVRALSRSVAVLRTNIVDSGLGMAVFRMFLKQDEDRQITFAASSVICNLINDCSPLRTVVMDQGLLPRLIQLLHSGESVLRVNALWTISNLLYHNSLEVKRKVMDIIGWHELAALFTDSDPGVQEQAFHILRHIADGIDDAEMAFEELGADELLDSIALGIDSEHDDVILKAVYALANLANSPVPQSRILSHTRVLAGLERCLSDSTVRIRQPAVSCVLELVKANPRSLQPLHNVGVDTTLRHMCEYTGAVSGSPTRSMPLGLHMCLEDEVREKAREALHWMEHNGEMAV